MEKGRGGDEDRSVLFGSNDEDGKDKMKLLAARRAKIVERLKEIRATPNRDYKTMGWKMEYLPPVVCNPEVSVIVEMREGVPEGLHGS